MRNSISTHGYIPVRIKQARVSRAMAQADLANAVGLSKQAVSQYETGAIQPTDVAMIKVADVLNYPLSFFIKEVTPSPQASSTVYFRSQKSLSVKEREACKQQISLMDELLYRELSKFIKFPRVNLPGDILEADQYSIDDCEIIANKLRQFWGLSDGPIECVSDILQENGIVLSQISLGNKKVDAFSQWISGIPYIFVSTDKESSVRWRFNVIHELGHLILHNRTDEVNESEHQRMEEEAHAFASAFLLPQNTFFKDLIAPSLEHMLQLKKKWGVSVAAMIKKCDNFEIFPKEEVSSMYRALAYRKWRTVEPLDDICDYDKPYLFKQAFELLFEHNVISKTNIESELCLRTSQIAFWSSVPESLFIDNRESNGKMLFLRTNGNNQERVKP